ncbi:MAG TPA: hypothetical protein VFJ30_13615, partial [Phycisphaerae bacterium]|nr:hypothetical protein [Phycisphaerae bacterium]
MRNQSKWVCGACCAALVVLWAAVAAPANAAPLADYDVFVEIQNTTPEAKADWPVIMTVYKVFGRNLPAGTVNPDGYHVYDESGKEIMHAIESIPPHDQQGNNEIIFLVRRIDKGQTLRYRITNTAVKSSMRRPIDLAISRHNLIPNGGFEKAGSGAAPLAGWELQAQADRQVKHGGSGSARLRGTRAQRMRLAGKIPLHKGSRYYFGIWGKTHEVSRFGMHTGLGGHVALTGFDSGWRGILRDSKGVAQTDVNGNIVAEGLDANARKKLQESLDAQRAAWIFPQCYTRDWHKSLPLMQGFTDWGLPEMCMTAVAEEAELTLTLDQRPQFTRPADQPGTWWLDDVVLIEQPKVTVRFDELLAPHVTDGLFLFTRPTNAHLGFCMDLSTQYCSMPYPRERADRLDRFALKGQRAVLMLGVYHTRPLGEVQVTAA